MLLCSAFDHCHFLFIRQSLSLKMVSLKKSSKVLTFSEFWGILSTERSRISLDAFCKLTMEEIFLFSFIIKPEGETALFCLSMLLTF